MVDSEVLSFIPGLLAIIAWVLALVANFRCYNISIDTEVSGFNYELQFGLFNYRGWSYLINNDAIYLVETCYDYNNVDYDSKWKSARALAITATVLGGIAMIANCIVPFVGNARRGFLILSLTYVLTALFQGLTLLFLQSDACRNNPVLEAEENIDDTQYESSCNLSWGANCSIASTVIWTVAGLAAGCVGRKVSKEEEDQMKIYEGDGEVDEEAEEAAEDEAAEEEGAAEEK